MFVGIDIKDIRMMPGSSELCALSPSKVMRQHDSA